MPDASAPAQADRDCEHGQLGRACDRCADAREIAQLRAALERKSAALQRVWRERDELRAQVGRIVDTVREVYAANAKASDGHTFRLLTPRQVQAWTALGAACGGLDAKPSGIGREEGV